MEVKPIVVVNGQLQQVQTGDVVAPETLPHDRETKLHRLFRILLRELVANGIVVDQELIDEAFKD